MVTPLPSDRVSEDEFYRTANEDADWEYLDGRIVMHSPESNRHGRARELLDQAPP